MKKISIIGCGTIGTEVAKAIDSKEINMELSAIYDIDKVRALSLKNKLKNINPRILENVEDTIKSADIVFESAKVEAVKQISEICFKLKKDLFVMSVGALIMHPEIQESAKISNCRVFFSSGAIAGLDGIKALKLSQINSVAIMTTKPLMSLKNSNGFQEFLKNSNMKLEEIKSPVTIFEGNVIQALKLFPENINVAAVLALNSLGPDKTFVKIIANPSISRNIHEVRCEAASGSIYSRIENVPHPDNPKTSYLAILSAISALKKIISVS